MRLSLLLLFILIAAGCTGSGGSREITEAYTVPRTGLQIKSFESDLDIVAAGDNFNLDMEIQNVGGARASSAEAELFKKGAFKVDNTPSIGPLSAPDFEYNTPGDVKYLTWRMTAPEVDNDLSYTFEAKVDYTYVTEGKKEFTSLSRERLRAYEDKGESPRSSPSDASIGPVDVRIDVQDVVLVGTSRKDLKIKVVLENIGDGIVMSETEEKDCTMKLGCVSSVVVIIEPGNTCSFNDGVQLSGGDAGYVTCTLDIGTSEERSYLVTAKATYDYQITASTDVTVKGDKSLE